VDILAAIKREERNCLTSAEVKHAHRHGHELSDCHFTYAAAVPGGFAVLVIGCPEECLRHVRL
jgi:hypothetical protein